MTTATIDRDLADVAPPIERQLLELLLAAPELVPTAAAAIPVDRLTHPGLRRILSEMYQLPSEGESLDLTALRVRLRDRPDLAVAAGMLLEVGEYIPRYERADTLAEFIHAIDPEVIATKAMHKARLAVATGDETTEIFRELQRIG